MLQSLLKWPGKWFSLSLCTVCDIHHVLNSIPVIYTFSAWSVGAKPPNHAQERKEKTCTAGVRFATCAYKSNLDYS
jgi:hypothetical protein